MGEDDWGRRSSVPSSRGVYTTFVALGWDREVTDVFWDRLAEFVVHDFSRHHTNTEDYGDGPSHGHPRRSGRGCDTCDRWLDRRAHDISFDETGTTINLPSGRVLRIAGGYDEERLLRWYGGDVYEAVRRKATETHSEEGSTRGSRTSLDSLRWWNQDASPQPPDD